MTARVWKYGLPLFVAAFVLSLFWHMPANVLWATIVSPNTGLRQSETFGTAWTGGATGVALGQIPIGRLYHEIKLSALGRGALAVDWKVVSPHSQGQGAVAVSLNEQRFNGTALTARLQGLPLMVPAAGDVKVEISEAVFKSGKCTVVVGNILVAGQLQVLGGPQIRLNGPIACVDQKLRIDLSGIMGDMPTRLSIDQTDSMTAEIRVQLSDVPSAQSAMLTSLGFERRGELHELVQVMRADELDL